MAVITKRVSEFPEASDPTQFYIFGQDMTTGQSAKARMDELKGDTGDSPVITISVQMLAYGSTPTVDKTGTNLAPNFLLGIPIAKNGDTPVFQISGGYMQYRYTDTGAWQNLVAMSTLKGDKGDKMTFDDLTDEDIADLQRPANDAVASANQAAQNANTQAANANNATLSANEAAENANEAATDAENAAELANQAAAAVQDGKTPVFENGAVSSLDPGSQPTMELVQNGTDTDGNPIYQLNLGVTKGDKGDIGISPVIRNGNIVTGLPGSPVNLVFTFVGNDTNNAPVYEVSGSVPQGTPGNGNGNVRVDTAGLLASKYYLFNPGVDGSPEGTAVEAKTSLIPNDSDYVSDADYNAKIAAALTALRVHAGSGIQVTIDENGDITLSADIDTTIFIPVTELPTEGIADKIYLLPKTDPETGNSLEEYMWVGVSDDNPDGYELLGVITVDLSNYYTKSESDARYLQSSTIADELVTVRRMTGANSVTTLANLPGDKRIVNATLASSSALSISASTPLRVGDDIQVFITPTANFSQSIVPNSSTWVSMDGSAIAFTSGKKVEMNIVCTQITGGNSYYQVSIKEQA